ncbi:MAG: PAS domain [Desulfobulbaceae bacterium]|nr:MAG: PAS domain [Desulfobulbaceae bacterium]
MPALATIIQPIKKYRVIASAIWIGTVLLSFLWNYTDDIREKNAIALETARAFFTQIVAVRSWNSEHGGVFVFTDEKTPLNPSLPKDQQALVTNDGRLLTRMNPAYMTRQIFEVADRQSKLGFHLTSLHPVRQENKALPWEEEWLKVFETGIKEKSTFVHDLEGEVFRYMAPLYVNETCLPCHAGYRKGDIRGGISISLPLSFHKSAWPLLISHVGAAIMGLLGIHFFASRLQVRSEQLVATNQHLLQEIEERKQSGQELVKIKDELESRVISRTAELSRANILLDTKIKEQEQVEKALVVSNDEFMQIFNSAPDGMQIIDRDFTIVRANRAFTALVGQDDGEIVGRKCFEVFYGLLCNTPECPLNRILAGAERVEVESRKNRADGRSFPCVVTATPFRAPTGQLTGIIEVTRDISSWKETERALSQSAHDLFLRNQELQDFSYVISHDLQEPLMLIQAFSQRLRGIFPKDLPEKAEAYLERIINSAERMQLLINGLLYYSRIEKDAQPFTEVNLNSIIQAVLEDLSVKIEESGAVVFIEKLGVIVADSLQMRQLFQNIIGNSLKYHHPDRAPEIRITLTRVPEGFDPDSHLSISIRDNGIGFKEEYHEKIFHIFQRLHTRQQFQGTGIGLTICKKIVEHHQGGISATAVQGQGAEFIVTLPLVQ